MEATRTRTVTPVHSAGFALARAVAAIGSVVAGVIVVGILLVIFDASQNADVVRWVTDAARWLTGPFHGLFHVKAHHWEVLVNWGLAAIVYFALSRAVARLLAR
jgi:hypothetical protein